MTIKGRTLSAVKDDITSTTTTEQDFRDGMNDVLDAIDVTADTESVSGNVTLDFANNTNFVLTLTGNVTLVNPSTDSIGQTGWITFKQDATGGRTLSLGTEYKVAGGTAPTLSTAGNAVDIAPYAVIGDGEILVGSLQKAFS